MVLYYREPLLDDSDGERVAAASRRRWKQVASATGVLAAGLAVAVGSLLAERANLRSELETAARLESVVQLRSYDSTHPDALHSSLRVSTGSQIAALATARPSSAVLSTSASETCTVAGVDIYDNSVGAALPCCDGLTQVNTPCRGGDVCQFCVPFSDVAPKAAPKAAAAGCTPVGTDMHANPSGEKLKCCPGLTPEKVPCRVTDMCDFCMPSTLTDGPRAEYPPAKVSIDPATPQAAVDKHKAAGMSLILSDEFKDLERTKSVFVFEDIPYGVPGNTGDVNIASTYNSDAVSLIPGGGLRLSSFMAPEDDKIFMQGWNGTYNTNWGSDVSLWSWHAPKVTSRVNGRFQYGLIETRIKAPKGYGPWPAAWLNGCYGFVAESSGEFLLQDDYPFLCGQFWPPELDFFEHFSPEHTWFWRPNSMSLHSPNQYVGLGKSLTPQGGYCPTTLSPPGGAWCFGVSGAGLFMEDPTEVYHDYAMQWDPDGVSYYMNDVFMHRFTKDQMVLYLSGQLRPILIPEMPLFLTFNVALVRKGMDLSHGGEGLTDKSNYDPLTGLWKGMDMDVEYVRVYQDDSQGETRGLNPPITYETKRKLLANRVTCNLIPELRCLVKNAGTPENEGALVEAACSKLYELGDNYCDTIEHLCSLNNAGNPEGIYGLSNASIANMANQHLSLVYGVCCIEEDLSRNATSGLPLPTTHDRAVCRSTPTTQLPQWLLESEYFRDPPVGEEGYSHGMMGTNPANWKTYGLGLPRPPSPPPPFAPPS